MLVEKKRRDSGRKTLAQKDRDELEFCAYSTTARLDQLAQFSAPDLSPAIHDEPRKRRDPADPPLPPKPRGGLRTTWPQGRHARILAQMQRVNHWIELGYAEKLRPYRDQPLWVVVTLEGLRWLGLPFTDVPFPAGNLNHIYVINEVRLFLLRSTKIPAHSWTGEREIQMHEPLKIRGLELPHRVDGVMTLEANGELTLGNDLIHLTSGERIAIEAERTRKDFPSLEKDILPDLLTHFDRVWYFCGKGAYDALGQSRMKLSSQDQRRIHIFRLNPHWWNWQKSTPQSE